MSAATITIAASRHMYSVEFVDSLSALSAALHPYTAAVYIIDQQVAALYPDWVAAIGQSMPVHVFTATEETKTLSGVEAILTILQSHGATRSTQLVGVGGGIVHDVLALAAHLYYRGLDFIYIPTTLLAMCDTAIGGKSGVNFNGYKNQIGAFHPPQRVLIWPGFIDTLSPDAIYSGLGEVVKSMLIQGPDHYRQLSDFLQTKPFSSAALTPFIQQSLSTKKKLIEEDEFDQGVRNLLNYGHTFGHAIESVTDYAIPHGLAVVQGMDIANYIAYRLGMLPKERFDALHEMLQCSFPMQPLVVTPAELIAGARRDKKATEQRVMMVLLKELGELVRVPVALDAVLEQVLADYCLAYCPADVL